MNWFSQKSLGRPTTTQAVEKGVVRDASFFGPVAQWQSLAVEFHPLRTSFVSRLLTNGCPSAISRLIVAIVVWITIQAVTFARALAHVRQKLVEGMKPPLAYSNATPAICGILRVAYSEASAFHIQPSVIFGSLTQAVLRVFSWPASAAQECVPATATDVPRSNPLNFAAVAATQPLNNDAAVRGLYSSPLVGNGDYSVSAFAVYESCHPACYMNPNSCWEI